MAEMINPEGLAGRWKVSTQHLARMRSDGTGPPFFKVGRLVRYGLEDITDYEQAHRRSAVRSFAS